MLILTNFQNLINLILSTELLETNGNEEKPFFHGFLLKQVNLD